MSYSRTTEWHESVTDERMAEFIMTWLTMFGMDKTTLEKASDVDDAIDDEDEWCWSVALAEGFIKRDIDRENPRLTKKAIKFIKEIV